MHPQEEVHYKKRVKQPQYNQGFDVESRVRGLPVEVFSEMLISRFAEYICAALHVRDGVAYRRKNEDKKAVENELIDLGEVR